MMMMLLMLASAAGASEVSWSPVIGIMAQPYGETHEYVAASYVKFVEAGGGRAVPLSYYASNETTLAWLERVNGVLLPGGGSGLPDAARLAVEYAQREPEFPVWGTCLGFEWISEALGANLSDFDAENITLPLVMTDAANSSYLLGDASLREVLATNNVTMNNHHYGVRPPDVVGWTTLSTSFDRQGQEFVSTAEQGNLYGVQWHPEKNAFETGERDDGSPYEVTNHSATAVAVTTAFAAKLVAKARRSTHDFPTPANRTAALFDHCFTSCLLSPAYVQTYFFPRRWQGLGPACSS